MIPWEKINSQNAKIAQNRIVNVGRGKNKQRINTACCAFDIETTNDNKTETAYMYIWQFGVNDTVYYGRTWNEFFEFIEMLRGLLVGDIIVLIHNMSFEMTFLLPRLYRSGMIDRLFAREIREPLEIRLKNGIVFRDTLALTNMSLAALAKNYCHTQKLVGDLDYTVLRNSETPLTDTELAYCENDVRILCEYAKYLHAEYTERGEKIPYTSTGVVRRLVKKQLPGYAYKNACAVTSRLYPETPEQYNYTMEYLYRGAFCHAQTAVCGCVLRNVHSHDLKSAYPAEMAHRLYPMTPFTPCPTDCVFDHINAGMAVIMLVEFEKIVATGAHVLESRHKIIDETGAEYENGRLYYADKITVLITEIDLRIYSMMYRWEKLTILCAKCAAKNFLPDYLLKPMMETYRKKELVGREYKSKPTDPALRALYMSIKMQLNSFYGMTVARLNLDTVEYNGEWYRVSDKAYYDAINDSVLSPYWGIYITAYTRLTICTALVALGDTAYYSDTDSIKHSAPFDYFNDFNAKIENINAKMCNRYGLDFNTFKNLGKFDYECTYTRFKTLGAKRYISETGGNTECAIAGLPKKTFADWVKTVGANAAFECFQPNLTFAVSGKNAHKYNGESTAIIDGLTMHEYGSCYIFGVGFQMRVDTGFLLAINKRRRI